MNKKILLTIIIIEAIIGLSGGYLATKINAYFCDIEESIGNTFTAAVIYGEIINFTAPENVIQGQTANFTITFKNYGIAVTAIAKIQIIRGEDGINITLIESQPTQVNANQITAFQLQWSTANCNPGNYRAIAWIEYDSRIAGPTDPTKFHVTNQKAADINVLEE